MSTSRHATNAAAVFFVLLLHAGALWAFNHGLTHKPAIRQPENIVMAQLLMPLGEEGEASAGTPDEPPAAQPAPPPPPPPPKEKPKPKPRVQKPKPKPVARPEPRPEPEPAPAVLAVEDSAAARAANAPVVAAAPPAPTESTESADSGSNATQHAAYGSGSGGGGSGGAGGSGKGFQGSGSGGGGVVQPSSSAAYLRNPKPQYPPMSRRLGETGRSIIRVLVGADGSAKNVRLQRSSGFDRLDQAALDAVRRWRFVPGTRGGVPEDMWFNVPIVWRLDG